MLPWLLSLLLPSDLLRSLSKGVRTSSWTGDFFLSSLVRTYNFTYTSFKCNMRYIFCHYRIIKQEDTPARFAITILARPAVFSTFPFSSSHKKNVSGIFINYLNLKFSDQELLKNTSRQGCTLIITLLSCRIFH